MFRAIILIVFLSVFNPLISQNIKNDSVPAFFQTLELLSKDNLVYRGNYFVRKEMLYFEVFEGKKQNGYKLLIKDIHPEGVFFHQDSLKKSIRIISINNGKLFIKEEFRNEFRVSNNANYIDIHLNDKVNMDLIDKFINQLKSFIYANQERNKIISDEIEIIVAPNKKGKGK